MMMMMMMMMIIIIIIIEMYNFYILISFALWTSSSSKYQTLSKGRKINLKIILYLITLSRIFFCMKVVKRPIYGVVFAYDYRMQLLLVIKKNFVAHAVCLLFACHKKLYATFIIGHFLCCVRLS